MKQNRLVHKFVELIPEALDSGVLYVSMEFRTVAHVCCCGCGEAVYLPLSPKRWKLTFDGESVSLAPSVGSWSLPCRSHYFITHDRVVWAEHWDQAKVERSRAFDADPQRYSRDASEQLPTTSQIEDPVNTATHTQQRVAPRPRIWSRIAAFFRSGD